jgi:hypothetical protein
MTVTDLPPVSNAVAHAKLGDPRRLRCLLPMVDPLAENPTASVPKAPQSTAAAEALYRLISDSQSLQPNLPRRPRTGDLPIGARAPASAAPTATRCTFAPSISTACAGRPPRPGQLGRRREG